MYNKIFATQISSHIHIHRQLVPVQLVATAIFAHVLLLKMASGVPVVDPSIAEKLKADKVANILISFTKSETANLFQKFDSRSLQSREDKLNAFYKMLKTHADQVQGSTMKLLQEEESKRQSSGEKPMKVLQLQITTQIMVRNAPQEVVDKLSALQDISAIHGEKMISEAPKTVKNEARQIPPGPQWGVKFIKADEIWKSGTKGKGVVVGVIDGGARHTHQSLKGNHRSSYGWFDPFMVSTTPVDSNGHGTMVTSAAVGQLHGMGVAPEAQWISCRSMGPNDAFSDHTLLACLNFMSCPTDANGANADCSKAPKVVNHSIGFTKNNLTWVAQVGAIHKKWMEMGILPIWAAANFGPACGTAFYIGDEQILNVGALDEDGTVADYSGRGPHADAHPGFFKPDVVAPGTNIFLSGETADNVYFRESGTSFAAPHVTGMAALFFCKFPTATVTDFNKALRSSSLPVMKKPNPNTADQMCGGIAFDKRPNHVVGYGKVDAVKLFEEYNILLRNRSNHSNRTGTASKTGGFSHIMQPIIFFLLSLVYSALYK